MRPLEGIRVLDLSRVLAGPFCTMSLGDLGAEVFKLEEPKTGDDTRAFGPPFLNGESTYFLSINRNKKSVAVDLKSPEGKALVLQLASRCDVVVENFRPGVAARLGFSAQALTEKNPRLIYCSISGFGQAFPTAGYDAVVQGLSGLMELTGHPDGPATRVGVPISDLLTGMTALQAILAALYERTQTGKGSVLDIAMLDSTVQVLTFHAAAALNLGASPTRLGNRHASIAPYEVFEASDGCFNLAVGNDAQFVALCEMLGTPELPKDVRFQTNPARVKNRPELAKLLSAQFKTQNLEFWLSRLGSKGIPCGAVLTVPQALKSQSLAARGMLQQFPHPKISDLKLLGSPLPQADAGRAPPPVHGQHTREVLSSLLGVESADIDRLVATGVLRV